MYMNPEQNEKVEIPHQYLCPIGMEIMEDPVITCDGYTFEKKIIEDWFRRGKNTNPLTNIRLNSTALTPNITLKKLIREFKQKMPDLKKQAEERENQKRLVKKLASLWNEDIKERSKETPDNSFSFNKKKELQKVKEPLKMLSDQWNRELEKIRKEMVQWKNLFRAKKDKLVHVLTYANRQERGEGMVGGAIDGMCVVSWMDGSSLDCQYIGGKPYGKGVMHLKNGNTYEGQYQLGAPHGKGIQYHKSGQRFEGDYVRGKKQGLGRYIFLDGGLYEGQFTRGERQGKGRYVKGNGTVFEGDFKAGKPYKGIKYYTDGRIKIID